MAIDGQTANLETKRSMCVCIAMTHNSPNGISQNFDAERMNQKVKICAAQVNSITYVPHAGIRLVPETRPRNQFESSNIVLSCADHSSSHKQPLPLAANFNKIFKSAESPNTAIPK